MRIIAFSDTHENADAVSDIFEAQPDAELYIFLGDGLSLVKSFMKSHPEFRVLTACGNCDAGGGDAEMKTLDVNGVRIAYCHGHRYGVKSGLERIKSSARSLGANILLFGHTHEAHCAWESGLWCLNPGKAASGSRVRFAIIDIDDSGKTACCVTSAG